MVEHEVVQEAFSKPGEPIREFPAGMRGDGKPIRDFPLELSRDFHRAFPGDEFERLFHEGAAHAGTDVEWPIDEREPTAELPGPLGP